MSSKISISIDEILNAVQELPAGAPFQPDPLDAAMNAMNAREKKANYNRVILYRFDQGDTSQADAYQADLQAGELAVIEVARELDCDLQLIEIGNGDSDPEDNARACAFGMMAAEEDTGLIAAAAFGGGSEQRALSLDPKRFFETATPEIAAVLGAMQRGSKEPRRAQ